MVATILPKDSPKINPGRIQQHVRSADRHWFDAHPDQTQRDRMVVPHEAEKIGEDTGNLRVTVERCPCGRVLKTYYLAGEGAA
jgi:hypothetical protein